MKRIVFLLSFLLFVFVLISGSGSTAFAYGSYTPAPPQVVNLVCSVTAPDFLVVAFSNSTNVTVTLAAGDKCAQDLSTLLAAGLTIKSIQTVDSNVVYTLSKSGRYGD